MKINHKSEISASMMCAGLIDLKETIKTFEEEKIDYLHIDVMDGTFVPNFGLGVDYIRGLRELTCIPLDLHLMVKDPEYKYQWLESGQRILFLFIMKVLFKFKEH